MNSRPPDLPGAAATNGSWTRDQLKLAFHFYCQTPFGKLHSRNPEIIELASLIGRTPSALAMKLVNFASLDPSITSTGRSGLKGASNLDREIWNEFHADWGRLALECAALRQRLNQLRDTLNEIPDGVDHDLVIDDFTGETRQVLIEQRIKQTFFRRAVLSSYRNRCCISRVSEPRLLVASHIKPWSEDKTNRLNPRNGLCLSAIHDRAFDKGLITLSDDLRVILSDELRKRDEDFIRTVFLPIEKRQIEVPERFAPGAEFIAYHRNRVFVDRSSP
jgi:putative restriction endonuclease